MRQSGALNNKLEKVSTSIYKHAKAQQSSLQKPGKSNPIKNKELVHIYIQTA